MNQGKDVKQPTEEVHVQSVARAALRRSVVQHELVLGGKVLDDPALRLATCEHTHPVSWPFKLYGSNTAKLTSRRLRLLEKLRHLLPQLLLPLLVLDVPRKLLLVPVESAVNLASRRRIRRPPRTARVRYAVVDAQDMRVELRVGRGSLDRVVRQQDLGHVCRSSDPHERLPLLLGRLGDGGGGGRDGVGVGRRERDFLVRLELVEVRDFGV